MENPANNSLMPSFIHLRRSFLPHLEEIPALPGWSRDILQRSFDMLKHLEVFPIAAVPSIGGETNQMPLLLLRVNGLNCFSPLAQPPSPQSRFKYQIGVVYRWIGDCKCLNENKALEQVRIHISPFFSVSFPSLRVQTTWIVARRSAPRGVSSEKISLL